MAIDVDADGTPFYRLSYDGRPLILPSRLGIDVTDGPDLDTGFEIAGVDVAETDTQWEQPWGERRIVDERSTDAVVRLANDDWRLHVHVRVFDDGAAFRYEIPAQRDVDRLTIRDEFTEFRFAEPGTAYWQTGDGELKYEHLVQTTPLAAVDVAHTPLTLRTRSGLYLSLHEAALVDYAAYRLEATGPGSFNASLRPWSGGDAVYAQLPMRSPWRTIQVATDAVGLLNSSLILNLNEPNALGDVSWVEPGKYTGIWWEIHRGLGTWAEGPRHAATTGAAKARIDFAADNGFDGVLVEGWNKGWDGDWVGEPRLDFLEAADDFDLDEVARYARSKGVRLVGHHETGGHVSAYERVMTDAFELLASHGVTQVKTGYVGMAGSLKRIDENGEQHFEYHDGQFAVRHHLRNVLEAARHRISINTHEPVKDTGLRRTYPNWITREGARGQEFNVWGAEPNPPEHEVLLSWTRLLAGPMDYTPGVFDLDFVVNGQERRVETTLARQLALYVTIYSPIQMVPDLAENYARFADLFRFIVDVPTDWEQSIALAGEIGDYVVIARRERGGDDWFIGAISDEQARTLTVGLDFLEDGVNYEATIYRDAEDAHWKTNPYAYRIDTARVESEQRLTLNLAAGGGTAIRLRPQSDEEEQ